MQDPVRRAEDEVVSRRTAYEAQLARPLEELSQVRAGYESKIKHQADKFSRERATYEARLIRQRDELLSKLQVECELQTSVIRARDEAVALLQAEMTESLEKNGLLSAQLSVKEREVDQAKSFLRVAIAASLWSIEVSVPLARLSHAGAAYSERR